MSDVVKSYKDRGKVAYVFVRLPLPEGLDEDGNETVTEYKTYLVRGLSPIEANLHTDILTTVEPPVPPKKKRAIHPLDGKIQASQLLTEDYDDFDDPTYQEQLKLFMDDRNVVVQRASMYRIMTCVQSFDISDEDIKAELDEDPVPRDPIDNLVNRIDQVCRIVLKDFDQRHLIQLLSKIGELSGVQTERTNFT